MTSLLLLQLPRHFWREAEERQGGRTSLGAAPAAFQTVTPVQSKVSEHTKFHCRLWGELVVNQKEQEMGQPAFCLGLHFCAAAPLTASQKFAQMKSFLGKGD